MKPRVLWCLTDGKAGHLNQMRGLAAALAQQVPIESHTLDAPRPWRAGLMWLTGSFPPGRALPDPDLILGAGHGTHLAVLAARRARGGRVAVLMKPSLPMRLFDLCIVPRHDNPPPADNVIVTRGVLNQVEPSSSQRPGCGLILIGGPSRHHDWDDVSIVAQVRAIVQRDAGRQWTLTTSRRTPATTAPALTAMAEPNLQVVPFEQTTPDWVPRQLAQASAVWVSEESVSMVYEALTSGAAVGLLAVRQKAASRVARGLEDLVSDNLVRRFETWRDTGELPPPPHRLHEAARCAAWIVEHWSWRR